MPKLDPTLPVQVQFSSAAFVHLAVAVAPTLRHVIDADAGDKERIARVMVKRTTIFIDGPRSVDDVWKESSSHRLDYLLYIYLLLMIFRLRGGPHSKFGPRHVFLFEA